MHSADNIMVIGTVSVELSTRREYIETVPVELSTRREYIDSLCGTVYPARVHRDSLWNCLPGEVHIVVLNTRRIVFSKRNGSY